MRSRPFIIGDWGTSSFTLTLCQFVGRDGRTLQKTDTLHGKGIKICGDPDQHLSEITASWIPKYGKLNCYLAGMVGSTIGWKDTAYVTCPAKLNQFQNAMTSFDSSIGTVSILSGAQCQNRLGFPDLMRGEEAQVLGWLTTNTAKDDEHLLCLPGTHTKWVYIKNGAIVDFLTVPRGELYQIICQHSILLDNYLPASEDHRPEHFRETILRIGSEPHFTFMNTLFSVRSRIVSGELTKQEATTCLSAILIGCDLRAALNLYQDCIDRGAKISVIGSEVNMSLYSQALTFMGHITEIYSSADSTVKGLASVISLTNGDD